MRARTRATPAGGLFFENIRWTRGLLSIGLAVFFIALGTVEAEAQRRNRRPKGYNRTIHSKKKSIRSYLNQNNRGYGSGFNFRPYYFVGGGINAFNYFGDLAPVNRAASTDISFTRPGFGAFAGWKFHPNAAVRGNYNFGILRGDDFSADPVRDQSSFARYERNLSFRNILNELSANLELSLLPEIYGVRRRPVINAHLSVGIAVFHHNPQAKVPTNDFQIADDAPLPAGLSPGDWVNLHPLDTEGSSAIIDSNGNTVVPRGVGASYSRIQLGIPLGVTAVSHITQELTVGLEFSWRLTFTDYLDDVSGAYLDLGAFENPVARLFSDRGVEPIAVVSGEARLPQNITTVTQNGQDYRINSTVGSGIDGSIRGNPDDNDMFFMTQIKVYYSFR